MRDPFENDYRNFFLVFIFNFNRHFFTKGEPILLHLLRYRVLAVKYHSFIPCASHLQQP